MRPCACRCGVSASHTWNTCWTFLPSLISSSALGNASRSSSGPICAWRHAQPARARSRRAARLRAGLSGASACMAVIVAEFDAACKIEAGDDHALLARQAGRRSQAEAARHHAVDGRPGPSVSTRCCVSESTVHLSSPWVANTRLSPSNSTRDIGAQRLAAAAFAHARDAENQADARAFAAQRAADADAHAVDVVVLAEGRGPPSHCISAFFQSRSRSSAPRMRARR